MNTYGTEINSTTAAVDNTYNYLLSNGEPNDGVHHTEEGIYEPTWIMFVEYTSTTNNENDTLIEVYKYIAGSMGTQTTTRRVPAEEARAEWNFWLGQGFSRITDPENKGWKYTQQLQARAAKSRMFESRPTIF